MFSQFRGSMREFFWGILTLTLSPRRGEGRSRGASSEFGGTFELRPVRGPRSAIVNVVAADNAVVRRRLAHEAATELEVRRPRFSALWESEAGS